MTTDNWERLLRCSECGAHDWQYEQVDSDNVLGTMRLHITCKNCHARFKISFGQQKTELTMPMDDQALAQRLMPHIMRALPTAMRKATDRRSF